MRIQLSDHFSYKELLKFAFPSIIMMVFTSLYSIVDGFFVSNYVGKTPFASINLIMPVIMILATIGFMFGTGGSALVAKVMGEGKDDEARRLFSLFTYSTVIGGIIVSVIAFIFLPQLAVALGVEGNLFDNCVLYGRILLVALPFYMLQYELQSFFVTAEKPQLGLVISLICGITNMVLDALFVAVFSWGLVGAAVATTVSQVLAGVVAIGYFIRPNTSRLRLTKASFDGKALLKASTNGASELMSNISASIVSMLYNMQLMKYAGENGVAAYGVLMYMNMIFLGIFIGYSTGTAPVVSYHYGAKNYKELKGLLKQSLVLLTIGSVGMFGLAELLATPLARIFVSYDAELMAMTVRACRIYAFSFLFVSAAIYGSSFFTALNDGRTSALISFLRTLVFQIAAVMLLPVIFGIDGIWFAVVVAEVASTLITAYFLVTKRGKYHYWEA